MSFMRSEDNNTRALPESVRVTFTPDGSEADDVLLERVDEQPPELRKGPEHAQHTEEVLLELGLSWDRITELKQAGAIN